MAGAKNKLQEIAEYVGEVEARVEAAEAEKAELQKKYDEGMALNQELQAQNKVLIDGLTKAKSLLGKVLEAVQPEAKA